MDYLESALFYPPHAFETICKQYLIHLNRQGLLEEAFEKIGKYYYDDPVQKKTVNLTLWQKTQKDIFSIGKVPQETHVGRYDSNRNFTGGSMNKYNKYTLALTT